MERFELNKQISNFKSDLQAIGKLIDRASLISKIQANDKIMSLPDFWLDKDKSSFISKEQDFLTQQLNTYEALETRVSDIIELSELLQTSEELNQLESDVLVLAKDLRHFKVQTLFTGEYDLNNAIFEIHAGAGGTEAMDWAGMLMRMYERFFEQNKFNYKLLEIEQGNEAGIKSCMFEVSGKFAFGYLKGESGVHRLVRISPFDSSKRRHTSFAAVSVTPVMSQVNDIIINDKDIKIDTYHSSGAGGQSVNTTMSAVRVTHIPTGIVVTCQNERSQIQNKEIALKILSGKLLFLERQKQDKALQDIKGTIKAIEWGSQIRSYVFQPYQMVKDHRTDYQVGNVSDVMNGEIINFIEEYLINKANAKK